MAFQRCKGVLADGKIGPVTWPLLKAGRAAIPPVTPVLRELRISP